MKKIKIFIRFSILLSILVSFSKLNAQRTMTDLPIFGAQIFIEPGQTEAEIDAWFRLLKENGMQTTRIRMFESYMHKPDGTWDFSLFDIAFKAADKYGIKVYGTIFPYTEKTDIGGFKFPRDSAHLKAIELYIDKIVNHFKSYKSTYGWVLMNEPGIFGVIPDNEFSKGKYMEWLKTNTPKEYTDKGFPILVELTDQRFLLDYTTWFLKWIAEEIKKHDTSHVIHVNNHAIFKNCAEYNFPAWRSLLTTLGGSAHAGWHYDYFKRDQYALAMSANSEIVRSGAGELPWMMTEIQGGNNTYSAGAPLCPTKYEIAQWNWIILGTQGKGGIFWSLNPRSSGIEAGEWAMLDFQDKATDRLTAASEVIEVIDANHNLFANAREVESGVSLIYIREAIWAERKMATPSNPRYEAREEGAVMKSLLGYFETLSELGINTNIKEFSEFDFSKNDYSGSTIILSNQLSIPSKYAAMLESFVSKGGKLIVDGLSGYFDENLHNTMKTGFPFAKLLGGNISEFKVVDNLFDVKIGEEKLTAHLWQGYISNNTADILSAVDGRPVATRNKFGKGETLWIPSLLGYGARMSDNSVLANFLRNELKLNFKNTAYSFATQQKACLMKTLQSGNSYITIVINKSKENKQIELNTGDKSKKSRLLYADKNGTISGQTISISSEESVVVEWK